MKKTSLFTILILFSIVLGFIITLSKKESKEIKNSFNAGKSAVAGYHYASTGNKEFYGGAETAKPLLDLKEPAYGGIVSHHLYIAGKTAEYFAGLAASGAKPETIVIIGPNHFNIGSDILVSRYSYKTPWGIVDSDREIIDKLIAGGLAENNEKPFEAEHSVSALVGFIKNSFPKAKIVPIIFRKSSSEQELEALARSLNENLPQESLVLASVDFSHHLNRIAAEFHDDKSISAIQNFDFENIKNLEIDSPPAIYAVLKYLDMRSAKKIFYANTNSALYSKNLSSEDTTSYVFAYFTKGDRDLKENISVLSFGDAMFGRSVSSSLASKDIFEKIRGAEGNFLRGADIVSLNLEGPITNAEKCSDKAISFKFSPGIAGLLRKNNFNIANLANNHTFDCGKEGLDDTKKYLFNSDLGSFGGLDSVEIKKINGQTAAFIGINATGNITEAKWVGLAAKLKSENDYVVVNIHWGIEYNANPSFFQIDLAHKLIDSGADIIIGHHPHVVQSAEIYKNKPIFYSLGNFIFDQTLPGTNDGLAVGAVLGKENTDLYLFPYKINKLQPELLSYDKAKDFCDVFLKSIPQKDACMISLP